MQISNETTPSQPQKQISTNIPVKNIDKKETKIETESEAKSWNEVEVEKWFNEINLKPIYEVLKPINGSILYQLYEIKRDTPEFYNYSMAQYNTISIIQVARFNDFLIKLFTEGK